VLQARRCDEAERLVQLRPRAAQLRLRERALPPRLGERRLQRAELRPCVPPPPRLGCRRRRLERRGVLLRLPHGRRLERGDLLGGGGELLAQRLELLGVARHRLLHLRHRHRLLLQLLQLGAVRDHEAPCVGQPLEASVAAQHREAVEVPERPERTKLAQTAQLIVREGQLLEPRHRLAQPCRHVLKDVA